MDFTNPRRGSSGPAKPARRGPLTWIVAGTVSAALLGLVLAQLDARSLAAAFDGVSWTLVGAGVALLAAENLLAAFRTHLIAGARGGFVTAVRVTAWHGLWLIALPMRLGEVAWVVAMRRAYGWNVATAMACMVVQRLLDVAVVSALLLLTMPAAFGLHEDGLPALAALAAVLCLLALVASGTLHVQLRLFAGLIMSVGRPRRRRRRFLTSLNQARHWLETVRRRRAMPGSVLLTVLIWTVAVAAWWTIGRAVGLADLTVAEFGFAAAGSILVAALPVQSIGGFGLLEAGFTGIATWLGAPAGTAALAALAIRFASMIDTGLFWLGAAALPGAGSAEKARAGTA